MPPPHHLHQQPVQSQQHHPLRPRGPPPFQEHGRPLAQQPLQPLIPSHVTHRSPLLRPQMEPPLRMMSSPPPNFPQHHQQQPPQPKNIHINPHFRGPTSSSVQGRIMYKCTNHTRIKKKKLFSIALTSFPLVSSWVFLFFWDSPQCCMVNSIKIDFFFSNLIHKWLRFSPHELAKRSELSSKLSLLYSSYPIK